MHQTLGLSKSEPRPSERAAFYRPIEVPIANAAGGFGALAGQTNRRFCRSGTLKFGFASRMARRKFLNQVRLTLAAEVKIVGLTKRIK
jgi:hypothetical protein